jgi:hypothetical protein
LEGRDADTSQPWRSFGCARRKNENEQAREANPVLNLQDKISDAVEPVYSRSVKSCPKTVLLVCEGVARSLRAVQVD